jgi:hypothetical protein
MPTLETLQNPSINTVPRRLYCYRYYAWESQLDEEQIWADVQRWGGSLSIRGDCIDFWVPAEYVSFFILKYPDLIRQQQLDYL